jgi:hypothetical protein
MKYFLLGIFLVTSCDGFLDADLDKSLITADKIFSNDVTATAAVVGMYNSIGNNSPLSAMPDGMAALAGLSSLELSNYPQEVNPRAFELHQISPSNTSLLSLWNFTYNLIYQSNAIVEGIHNSKTLSHSAANQLEGESRFVRAFAYFYLVNLFGGVPIVIETNYHSNALLSRRSLDEVYAQIENDLIKAQSLMSMEYIDSRRMRPNQATATALLARMYLYRDDYTKAETEATAVINNSLYALKRASEINEVFLIGSGETIWQIPPIDPGQPTEEARFFIVKSTPPLSNIMTDALRNHFEPGDTRFLNWIGSISGNGRTFYFPYKYKQKSKNTDDAINECSIVFRLAEMLLIRAEARAKQGKLVGANSASSDLNIIRARAGLPEIVTQDKETLLLAIDNERWSELFTEYGHRWLDLKRTRKSIEILGNGITQEDLLWPIPAAEFTKNPNLGQQNPGY